MTTAAYKRLRARKSVFKNNTANGKSGAVHIERTVKYIFVQTKERHRNNV
ncbi:MAG: hypothetical protein LBS81_04700 [Endomicrobium sp.]|nr:hypothetical protein [Endomicrobium sp.]